MANIIINTESPVCVVGIGASAGGLEAIGELLSKLPDNTGMAFVIIQHLSPDYKSMLSEILCKYTMMAVVQAENGQRLERNTVYLIPPKYNMEVRHGSLMLHEYVQSHVINHPIDIFLRSLAREYQTKAIAVILSGTGSDGTNGIRTIKEQGGMILVQSPESAKFDGMPRSALQTGFADMCIPPEAIAGELTHIAVSLTATVMGMSNEELLNKIYSILKKVSNINYTYYKQTTISRRIERRMVVTHQENLYDYVNLLRNNTEEAAILAKEVLIGVTSFFRDAECFEALKKRVVIPLIQNCPESKSLRVWVAGCSTGEEAYSVGILFLEAMDELDCRRDVKIFATDLEKESVITGGRGQYGENIIEDVSARRLGRYFTKKGSSYIVSRDLRKLIVFAPQNVFQDPPFGRLDLVCCRNMLIYFQNVLQKDLFAIFHIALNDNGYLFLGKSETVGGCGDIFTPICSNEKIYMHNAGADAPVSMKLHYSQPPIDGDIMPQAIQGSRAYETEDKAGNLEMGILEEFLPPCVLVDDRNVVCHIFGDCNNFLRFPRGKAELELYGLLTPDLRIAVSTALKDARSSQRQESYGGIALKGESHPCVITLVVAPVSTRTGENSNYTAVLFMEGGTGRTPVDAVPYDVDAAASQRISDLEKELTKSQMELKHTVSELETVNEELQATNEELLTANEELQSSNEELQSVNEELYTVNAEFQEKLGEVTSLNDDISNFLSSTLVGIIFLDEAFQIRRFTTYVSQEFSIMAHDIGRSVQFMAYHFINIDLMSLCEQVSQSLTPIETDAASASGKSYFMRIAPYQTEGHRILGLVITFVDTTIQSVGDRDLGSMQTALYKARQANREKDNFLSRMSHDMRTPLNAIIGIAQLIAVREDLPDDLAEEVRTIQENGEYLQSIIGEILRGSRIGAGKLSILPRPTREDLFVGSILPILQNEATLRDIALTTTAEGVTDRRLMVDRDHVKQVLVNLLSNAVKYTGQGGRVEFSTMSEEGDGGLVRHTYTITDNGRGMSEAFQKRMYHPFEQEAGEDAELGNHRGTGLGLYIVKEIVDAMAGTITCQSTPNHGTTFTVVLTYAPANPDGDGEGEVLSEEGAQEILAGRRVMICEDQAINSDIAAGMLRRIGVETEVAVNGREAVEKFMKSGVGHYQAILMDIRMPELNGLEATVAIRSSGREDAATVPIIAMTADMLVGDRNVCVNAGMDDCIYKPVDMKALYSTLAKCVRAAH